MSFYTTSTLLFLTSTNSSPSTILTATHSAFSAESDSLPMASTSPYSLIFPHFPSVSAWFLGKWNERKCSVKILSLYEQFDSTWPNGCVDVCVKVTRGLKFHSFYLPLHEKTEGKKKSKILVFCVLDSFLFLCFLSNQTEASVV